MDEKKIWEVPEIHEIVEEASQENIDGNIAYLCSGGTRGYGCAGS